MKSDEPGGRAVLVTGAAGYIGRLLIDRLAADAGRDLRTLVATDLRPLPESERVAGVVHVEGDVRDPSLATLMADHRIDTVVHLAAVVTPGPGATREELHSIDVGGTTNVLEACRAAGIRRLIVTSSGAAYGYHRDNPEWLEEDAPLRGNPEFAYSDHKRQVEELLERWRQRHPELEQVVLRPGAILGTDTRNQITDIFDKPLVFGIAGASTPFTFTWDRDVVGALVHAVFDGPAGVYNLAGDGVLTLAELAGRMGKPYVALPAGLVRAALAVLHPLGLTQYGPEQVDFLRYRPVLSNRRLKEVFGYVPEKSTREVFETFWRAREAATAAKAAKATGARR